MKLIDECHFGVIYSRAINIDSPWAVKLIGSVIGDKSFELFFFIFTYELIAWISVGLSCFCILDFFIK